MTAPQPVASVYEITLPSGQTIIHRSFRCHQPVAYAVVCDVTTASGSVCSYLVWLYGREIDAPAGLQAGGHYGILSATRIRTEGEKR